MYSVNNLVASDMAVPGCQAHNQTLLVRHDIPVQTRYEYAVIIDYLRSSFTDTLLVDYTSSTLANELIYP